MNIFRIITAVLIIFIPLYPKFPLVSIHGTYVAIRLDDILVGIAILIWLFSQIKNRFPVFKEKITYLFIAYFIALTLSALNAFLIFQNVPTNILILNTLRRFEYMSLFFITLSAIKKPKDLKFAYYSLLIASFFASLYGFGQKYFHFPVVSTMNEEFSKGMLLQMSQWTRISSTFAGHYDLAAYMSLVLIIIGAVFILSKNIYLKIISLIVWLASFQILIFTASRISPFAFWGAMAICLILIKKQWWIVPVSLLLIFNIFNSKALNQRLLATISTIKKPSVVQKTTPTPVPTAIPTIIAVITPKPVTITTPVPTIVRRSVKEEEAPPTDADGGVARSGDIRVSVEWPRAINAFKRNPLLGSGPGSITLATDNDYFRSLGETGLLGFLTFFMIPIFFSIQTFFIFKKKHNIYSLYTFVFLAGLASALANALYIDVFEASKFAYSFWIFMAIFYRLIEFSKCSNK